jgi:uncharacterized protein (DUF488 family)
MTTPVIYTIGHSNHEWSAFLALLHRHDITALGDVRSSPYSRMYPQFGRANLERALRPAGITYVFLGREFGARSEDRSCYVDGRVSYERLGRTAAFAEGVERVRRGAATHRIALMCAERDPLDCHRTILVAEKLMAAGFDVRHILADGAIEPHDAAVERLLALHDLVQEDFFRSRDMRIRIAFEQQESKIAYSLASADAEQTEKE